MNKKLIRLTESDLHRIVKKSVNEILKGTQEWDETQNPIEWSEEDEDFLWWSINNLEELKNRFGENYGKVGKCINWLKSLKERMELWH